MNSTARLNHISSLDKSKSYSCLVPERQVYNLPSSISSASLHPHSSKNKRFHTAQLGKPPGAHPLPKPAPVVPHRSTSTSAAIAASHYAPPKIAPMKEVEKMITDLKKENFDLKLRLYHLENLLNKDTNINELRDQNHKLRTQLEHKNRRMDSLEQEVQALLEKVDLNDPPTVVSIGTQTDSMSVFASSPEAFGLEPRKQPQSVSWQRKVVANEDHLMSVLDALQHIQIDKNKLSNDSWSNQKNTKRRPFQK